MRSIDEAEAALSDYGGGEQQAIDYCSPSPLEECFSERREPPMFSSGSEWNEEQLVPSTPPLPLKLCSSRAMA